MTSSLPSLSLPTNPLSYGRLRPAQSTNQPDPTPARSIFKTRQALLLALSAIFLVAASAVLAVAIAKARYPSGLAGLPIGPTRAITLACGQTEYPMLCVESLAEYPGAMAADAQWDLVPISMNLTIARVGVALMKSAGIENWQMDSYDRSAYGDCIEMLDDSVDLLNRSLLAVAAVSATSTQDGVDGRHRPNKALKGTAADVMTWLSAALTNQDTCVEQLETASNALKVQMSAHLQDLSALVSNALAIYATSYGGEKYNDLSEEPTNNRRLLSSFSEEVIANEGYPSWLSRGDREMLQAASVSNIQPNVMVSPDGSPGTVRTIAQAIAMAPQLSQQRFVIHIKSGIYQEDHLLVPKKKNNVWLIGDGMGQTVITGYRSVGHNRITTFDSATFGVAGEGFLAIGITFENKAGPTANQAVALRLGNDRAVLFQCEIRGYQDSLYTYAQRHFFRECTISGTVDFIFGNGAVVFQKCTIISQKPMPHQKCTITAQARRDPRADTGISFHMCNIVLSEDQKPYNKGSSPTFLGRPWQFAARVVYMKSYLGEHVDPKGWMEWGPGLPLDRVYYGEFQNGGPGARTDNRVHWPGVHSYMSPKAANKFTVGVLLQGAPWLTPTNVPFENGI